MKSGAQIKFNKPVSGMITTKNAKSSAVNFIDENKKYIKDPTSILTKEYRKEDNINVIGTKPM